MDGTFTERRRKIYPDKEYRMTFLDVLRDPQGSGKPRGVPRVNYKRLWSTPFVAHRGG